jgi:thiosulfate dehydrogenase
MFRSLPVIRHTCTEIGRVSQQRPTYYEFMIRFLIGVIFGILLVAFCGYVYFAFGYAPVATAASPMPFEVKFAHMALNHVIDREAPKNAPIQPSEDNYMAGVHIYREQCAVCHGLPGQTQPDIAKGEFPRPPQLFKGKGVTDDPAGETYWKVANGIRLTGMPAYSKSLSDVQIWQVSLLLANADKISPTVKGELSAPLTVK